MVTETVSSDSLPMLPVEVHPNVDHLVTEDDTPVDNVFSEKQQRLLTEPLHSSWREAQQQIGRQRSFVAMSNVGLFYALRRPPLVPDAMLSMDVDLPADISLKCNRSYFVWEYGKVPDVVIEVVSNREGGEDTDKLIAYARAGVRYYVIYDPDQFLGPEVLRAYRLEGPSFRTMDEPIWFPDVGLGLRLWQGQYEDMEATWIRWAEENGTVVPTGSERAEAAQRLAEAAQRLAEAQQARADTQQTRADAQQTRADTQQARADRLAEKLRQLGVEPNGPNGS